MLIAFFDTVTDTQPKPQDVTWEELKRLLTTHTVSACAPCVGHKCPVKLEQRGWAPVDIGPIRRSEHVRAVTAAVFDLDGLSDEGLSALPQRLDGYAAAVHSTHGHRPGNNSLRVVVPLTRPALRSEWPAVRAAAVRLLDLPADPSTKDLGRMYFLPNHSGEHPTVAWTREGHALDVDALLVHSRAPSQSAPATMGAAADLFDLRALLRRVRKPEHRELIRRTLAGEPLAERGAQDTTLNTLMSCCAFVLPLETPEDVVLELFRDCFAATDWGEGTEHLREQARLKLRRHRARRTEADAKRLAENEAIWRALGTRPPTAQAPGLAPEEGEEDPEAWGRNLIMDISSKGDSRLRNCEANVFTVLLSSPEWRGVLRFNEVSKRLEVVGGPLPPGLDPETLDVEIANWLQQSEYGRLGLQPKAAVVAPQILAVAKRNRYDPVADYLQALEWDGVPRLAGMLARYFGAEGDVAHLRTIGEKFAIGAVARALRPGCKVDTVLILEGPQGLRKSTALRVLAGDWFSDAPIDVHNKDSAMLASQFWFIELAELSTLRRAENQPFKGFISRTEDTYRPPYGRANVKTPRRCIFVGTTNDDAYLKDPTGHRRYWPVHCTHIDIEALRQDRNQLWAEAVVLLQRGEPWWLSEEDAQRAEAQAALRAEGAGDGRGEAIVQWFLRTPKERRPAEVSILQVATDALGMPVAQVDHRASTEVGTCLVALGFTKHQRRSADGRRPRMYRTPEDLLTANQEARQPYMPPSVAVPMHRT
ncbi:VapE domain-containing protein [Corallococcus sp. Z5C101001]|uniref:VapE domain-containing protein n=1 Tax=Corallococcus sp. Z5C101001 TaxID=2596829 RepID=UPI001180E59A|nr:VapE domain-containing protein [Corallococcus sp. Z5C101001]TSC19843.1 DNA primase [Corallococcus sp. Z5C101001]